MRDDLLEDATAARLARARAGEDVARRLQVSSLEPGQVGILDVQVRAVAPVRRYDRKRGGEGLLQRLTLADATGEVDLVLWDDEVRHAKDGAFQTGAFLRLRGAAVKAGHRGGIELGLGSALVEPITAKAATPGQVLDAVVAAVGDVRPIGAPPALRFNLDVTFVAGPPAGVALWDEAVKHARGVAPGDRLRIEGATPNPLLDGWWRAGSDAKVTLIRAPPGPTSGSKTDK